MYCRGKVDRRLPSAGVLGDRREDTVEALVDLGADVVEGAVVGHPEESFGVDRTHSDVAVVGREAYPDTPMGRAKKLDDGFVKVLAAPDGEILGCHILGYEASTLLHEVVVAMRSGTGTVADITDTIHAHPTLNKVVEYAFDDAAAQLR